MVCVCQGSLLVEREVVDEQHECSSARAWTDLRKLVEGNNSDENQIIMRVDRYVDLIEMLTTGE